MEAQELAAELDRVTPQWARCYDFGSGRLPGFLNKLIAEH
jgi:hypothetical protein